ncbi:uncharacterized protein LOC142331595 isoform X3 [Lycorma delicatula]|uniref:uncharacterized protein LOC142331595 isoform X3 n=1 Tax=Lycorma delicatula TaxID=130591 RepID=UPI003F519887
MDVPSGNTFMDEDPLHSEVKLETKDETEEMKFLFVPVVKTEGGLTSDHIMDVSSGNTFMNEDPLHSEIKLEIKDETEEMKSLLVPVVKTEGGLRSDHNVDGSHSSSPEKEDLLHVDSSNTSSTDPSMGITSVEVEQFVVEHKKVDLGVEALERISQFTQKVNKRKHCDVCLNLFDVDKSYSSSPEKKDPLHVDSSNTPSADPSMGITSIKLQQFDVEHEKVDLGVEALERISQLTQKQVNKRKHCLNSFETTPRQSVSKFRKKRRMAEERNKFFNACTQVITTNKDEYTAFGITVAAKLRKMDENQRVYAENAVNLALFKGQLKKLSETSTITNEASSNKHDTVVTLPDRLFSRSSEASTHFYENMM